ncbi:copper amine oxidase N-terminal domain-containing protein [Bacillus sp. FJAT-42315]|uniref:copper amine oxidase N-terminal domain-containing protein n=1 Tax=Bacillus sp. FJAT-42315 TaxID=2014077 RepID=UPI000C243CB6|nr:copper amine oxidase N-terminal domain-containing protein [Bacillus sp. FJAT-42315]
MNRNRKYLGIVLAVSLVTLPVHATYADEDEYEYEEYEHEEHEYEEYEDDDEYDDEYDDDWYEQEERRQPVIEESWYSWSRASVVNLANEPLPLTKQQEVKLQQQNETEISIDAIPYQGQLLVPLKQAAQYLKAEVYEYKKSKVVEVVDEDTHLIFKEGSRAVYENMAKTPMPTAAFNFNGKMYVPVNVIGEALGWDVSWSNERIFMKKGESINGES